MITIIDSGLGNLNSIRNAFDYLGAETQVASSAESLGDAHGIILPGVGAFSDGMKKLENGNWVTELDHRVRRQGVPFLGICLGMQMLAEQGSEGGLVEGLGWVPGTVEKIVPTEQDRRLPHMGWNDVRFHQDEEGMSAGMGAQDTFYFMHSFSLRTSSPEWVKGETDYAGKVTACLEHGHIWATQFHPEKSQKAGIQVLRNFIKLVKEQA